MACLASYCLAASFASLSIFFRVFIDFSVTALMAFSDSHNLPLRSDEQDGMEEDADEEQMDESDSVRAVWRLSCNEKAKNRVYEG